MTSRILGSVGRFLITSGIVVLLFVGYQLWGTGLQEASAQGSLADEFDELLDAIDVVPTTAAPTTVAPTTTEASTTSAPATTTTTVPEATTTTANTIAVWDEALAEALYRDGGEAIARLTIPAIDVRKVVVEGVQVEDLRNGPGHYRATVLPGQQGNSGIAGHRTTYGAPFNRIDELVPGDEVNIRTVQGFHQYRVLSAVEAFGPDRLDDTIDFAIPEGDEELGHIIVRPEAVWVLGDFGDDRITLTACHPKYSAARRIIVAAELISEPVDAPPPPADYVTGDANLATEDIPEDEATGGRDVDAPADEETDGGPAPTTPAPATPSPGRAVFANEVTLDEGLNGDESALLPAILWGAAAIIVYLGFKELARRWRFWPSVAIGFVPVVLLMGLAFEKIDRYLPAG